MSCPGFQYANLPMMTRKKGERVRWYAVTLGEGLNLHTPHWHGKSSCAEEEKKIPRI
jgi:manganese oxidase